MYQFLTMPKKSKKEIDKGGRPAKYDDNYHPYVLYAIFWENQSIKVSDVCEKFGINNDTFCDWVKTKPKFSEAYQIVRSGVKGMLLHAALKEAVGYDYYEETTSKDGVVEIRKRARPQMGIVKLLLSNFGIREQVELADSKDLMPKLLAEISEKMK